MIINSEHTPTAETPDTPRTERSNFTIDSKSSLQSKLGEMKLEDLYKKITSLALLMNDNEISETYSLLQSVVTMESELKTEKCRDRLSFLYIFLLGLSNKMNLRKPPISLQNSSISNSQASFIGVETERVRSDHFEAEVVKSLGHIEKKADQVKRLSIFDQRGKSSSGSSSFTISGIDRYETPEYFELVKNLEKPQLDRRRNSYAEDNLNLVDSFSHYYSANSPLGNNTLSMNKNHQSDSQIEKYHQEENFENSEKFQKKSILFRKELEKITPRIMVTRDDLGTEEKLNQLSSERVKGNSSDRFSKVVSSERVKLEIVKDDVIEEENEGEDDTIFNDLKTKDIQLNDLVEEKEEIKIENLIFEEKNYFGNSEGNDENMDSNRIRDEIKPLKKPSSQKKIDKLETGYKITLLSPETQKQDHTHILNSPSTNNLFRSYFTPPENSKRNHEKISPLGKTLSTSKHEKKLNNSPIVQNDELDVLQDTIMAAMQRQNYATFSDFINIKDSPEKPLESNITHSIYSVNDDTFVKLLTQDFSDLQNYNESFGRRLKWKNSIDILKDFMDISQMEKTNFQDEIFEPNLYSIIGDGRNKLCLNLITLDYLGWLDLNLLNFDKIHKKILNFNGVVSSQYKQVDQVLNILRDEIDVLSLKKEEFCSLKIFNFSTEKFFDVYSDLKIPVDKKYLPLFTCMEKYGNLDLKTFTKILKENCLVLKLLAKHYGSYDHLIGKSFDEIFSLLSGGILSKISSENFFEFYENYYGLGEESDESKGMILFKDGNTEKYEFLLFFRNQDWFLRDLRNHKVVIFKDDAKLKILKNLKNFEKFAFFKKSNFSRNSFLVREMDVREDLMMLEVMQESEILKEKKEILALREEEGKHLVGNWKDWITETPKEEIIEFLSPKKSQKSSSKKNNSSEKKNSNFENSSEKYFSEEKKKYSIFMSTKLAQLDFMFVEMNSIPTVTNVIKSKILPNQIKHCKFDLSSKKKYFMIFRKNDFSRNSGEILKIFSKNRIFLRRENRRVKLKIYEMSLYYSNVRSMSDSGKKKFTPVIR